MTKGIFWYGVPRRLTRRLLSSVVGSEACVVFFGGLVAMAMDKAAGRSGTGWLVAGAVLGVLCIACAGLMRRPWGITLGWLVHLATLVAMVKVPMMGAVTLIFGGLWWISLVQGAKIDDLSDEAQRRYDAEHGIVDPQQGS